VLEQLVNWQPNIFRYLSEQDRGYVTAFMVRHSCATSSKISELLIGSPLANFGGAELNEDRNDFIGFEDAGGAHTLGNGEVLYAHKL